jgi:uncharacterized protein
VTAMRIGPVEGRVVGSLVEKQLTTPQQYPLTANALVAACNQSSNRDPVVRYAEAEVAQALEGLKADGLVRFVLPSHGRSVVRYRHVLDEVLALDPPQLALLALLLLRGPQTAAELRSRAERMTAVGSVEHDLGLLAERDLVEHRSRQPGEKEARWVALLADPAGPLGPPVADVGPGAEPAAAGRATTIRGELAALQAEVAELRAALGEVRAGLGELRDSLGG